MMLASFRSATLDTASSRGTAYEIISRDLGMGRQCDDTAVSLAERLAM